jgi:hypothetical protein
LAKFAGVMANTNVYTATQSGVEEQKAHVANALHTALAEVEACILPGGGLGVAPRWHG